MLYIPKIDKCLKILTDEEVKDFVVMNVSEYFKSTKKISEKLLNRFISLLNLFDTELQLKDTEFAIKTKLKELFSKLKRSLKLR